MVDFVHDDFHALGTVMFFQKRSPQGDWSAPRRKISWDNTAVETRRWEEILAWLKSRYQNVRVETYHLASGWFSRVVRAW